MRNLSHMTMRGSAHFFPGMLLAFLPALTVFFPAPPCASGERQEITLSLPYNPGYQREYTEWVDFRVSNAADPHLPKILLIGDSIVGGYWPKVAKELAGKAVVGHLASSKCVGDPGAYLDLDAAVRGYHWDIIQINNGLHGKTTREADYAEYLAAYVDFLRRIAGGATVIWAHSTPVTQPGHPDQPGDFNARVIERNRLAAGIMERRGIGINDLYHVVIGRPELSCRDGYHYNEAGNNLLAAQVAATLQAAMEKLAREAPKK